MAIFSAFLPALREVRNPLSGGMIWLLAAWLIVGDEVRERTTEGADSNWILLRDFVLWGGDFGRTAILLFLAYAVGSLFAYLIAAILGLMGNEDAPELLGWRTKDEVDLAGSSVGPWIDELLRRRSEGLLRLHLAAPSALVCVLMAGDDKVWLWGLAAIAILFVHGLSAINEADREIKELGANARTHP